ncbi:RAD55 family ATPase [Helicobacter felis]|uniref:RAD55 family ATPase n=1 Tax=Helicobacter felis TaxID=214 RepID=UPI000CF18F4A|nr:ATPase domain-containing protein [Helicobacter felis]
MSNTNNLLEQTIVRSIVAYPEFAQDFLEGLPLECFDEPHQKVLSTLLSLKEQGKSISLALMIQHLGQEFCNSKAFSALFGQDIDIQPNYLSLKEDLRHALLLKAQGQLGDKLIKATLAGEILDADFLSKYTNIEPLRRPKTLKEWNVWRAQQPTRARYSTGIKFLDDQLKGGFTENSFILLGGAPEAGKTTLGVQILRNISLSVPCLYFSFEFPAMDFLDKMQHLKDPTNTPFLESTTFYMEDEGSYIEELVAQIKKCASNGIKFFLIDSQMMINTGGSSRRNEEEQTKKFSRLAQLVHGQKLDIVIMLIVQSSKTDQHTPFDSILGMYLADAYLYVDAPKEKYGEDKSPMRYVHFLKNKIGGGYKKGRFRIDGNSFSFVHIPTEDKGKDSKQKLPFKLKDTKKEPPND